MSYTKAVFFILCSFALHGQLTIEPVWELAECQVIGLAENNADILFWDLDGNGFTYDGSGVSRFSKQMPQNVNAPLNFDANALTFEEKTVVLPSMITCALKADSSIYIGTENGLFQSTIPLDVVAQQFYRDDLPNLGFVQSILKERDYLIFSDSTHILIWDELRNQFFSLPNTIGVISSIKMDEYGQMFFASASGLHKLNLDKSKNLKVPLLEIEENGFEDLRRSITIDSGDLLLYTIKARHPIFQDSVMIHSELKGKNIDRQQLLKSNTFVLKDLKAGEYNLRFFTRVKNQKNANFSDSIRIEVKPKARSSFWWYVFGTILLLFLLYAVSYLKSQQFNKDIIAQRDKLLLENKALKFEQKALQLQMNPHFLFNVLNSINGMIALEDNQNARKYINEFSQLMRSVLSQSRSETISLEQEINYLKKYVSLERITRNESFEYDFSIDSNLNLESQIKPMIVQPFLENAILHGFKQLKRPAILKVDFLEDGADLKIVVWDNGVGRSNLDLNKKHKSVGLSVVQDRLGKNYGYTFDDLKDENGEPLGTKVNIKMPLI